MSATSFGTPLTVNSVCVCVCVRACACLCVDSFVSSGLFPPTCASSRSTRSLELSLPTAHSTSMRGLHGAVVNTRWSCTTSMEDARAEAA